MRSELINSRKDLNTQRFAFERQLEVETHRLQSKIDSLENRSVTEYNSGVTFCDDCIMFVIKKEYLELDMRKLEAGVNAYMDEQNKEAEKTKTPPQPTEETPAHPCGQNASSTHRRGSCSYCPEVFWTWYWSFCESFLRHLF